MTCLEMLHSRKKTSSKTVYMGKTIESRYYELVNRQREIGIHELRKLNESISPKDLMIEAYWSAWNLHSYRKDRTEVQFEKTPKFTDVRTEFLYLYDEDLANRIHEKRMLREQKEKVNMAKCKW